MLPPFFLGVGPQGFDQKGMDKGHSSTLLNKRATSLGACLAEEPPSLKSPSHLEELGLCLRRAEHREADGLSPSGRCLPAFRGRGVAVGPWPGEGLDGGSLPHSGYPS